MDKKYDLQFAVVGLGRFGMSIVRTLSEYDVNILACDVDSVRLHEASDYATQVIRVDASDEDSLASLGLGNFDVVVVATGEDFEASILATMIAKESGAKHIVARAHGWRQKKILESVGAHRVVLPETEMGIKLAHTIMQPNIMDALGEYGQHKIIEMHPMEEWIGKTVGEADVYSEHGHTIIAVIRDGETIVPVKRDLVMEESDILVTINEDI